MLVKRLSAGLLALSLIVSAGAPVADDVLFEDNILASAVSDDYDEDYEYDDEYYETEKSERIDKVSGDFRYYVDDDGNAVISCAVEFVTCYDNNDIELYSYISEITDEKAYLGKDENVVIPQELDGRKVVGIAKFAFSDCKNIKSVKMPDTITYIENDAFVDCENLESVELSKNLQIIEGAYGSSYTGYTRGAFENCTSLKSIVIPNSCTEINHSAFMGCTSLTSVTLPDNDHCLIHGSAFTDCSSLKEVYIPRGIEFDISSDNVSFSPIGLYGWGDVKITVASDNPYIGMENGILYDKDTKKDFALFGIPSDTKVLKIPSAFKTFDEMTIDPFTNVEQIEEVIFPDTLTSITENKMTALPFAAKFYNVKKMTIPKSVTKMDCYTLGFEGDENGNLVVNKNFVIRCYKNSAAYDYAVKNNIKYELIDADNKTPGNVIAKKYTSTTNAVRINWNKVSGASGYRVYKYNTSTKKWDKVKDVSAGTLTYKFTGLKAGTTYKYKVKAYTKSGGQTVWGNASSTITTATKPAKPTITKASKSASAVRLYWNKVSGASGYKLQQYDNASKKWKTVKVLSSTDTNYKVSGLKSNTAYKFRIQAYKSAGGQKTYSAWSATKKATTKK